MLHRVLEWRIDNIQRTIRSDETEQLFSHTPSPSFTTFIFQQGQIGHGHSLHGNLTSRTTHWNSQEHE